MKNSRLGKILSILALFCGATVVASSAQTLTTIGHFGSTTGDNPLTGSLIQGTDGNFYGTNWGGGNFGAGTIYRVTPSGTVSLVYAFCKVQFVCADGATPVAVMQAANGNLYGTTSFGGAYDGGTAFEISKSGTFTSLYSFPNNSGAGLPLVQGPNGNIYGSQQNTIFQITPAGVLTTLVTLPTGVDASQLVLANDGKFYGTTGAGGIYRDGFFFSLTPAGKVTSLYSFNSATDGAGRTLTLGTDGNFYGTAQFDGPNYGGTVFKITPTGQFTLLHIFGSCAITNCSDGMWPTGALVQGTDGNFYGSTPLGGTGGVNFCNSYCGTAFQITPSGTLTTLYDFCSQSNCSDGSSPYQGMVQGTDGNFYGATYTGGFGIASGGTIYRISMGLAPFVKTSPTFGQAGWTISILGTNLTAATSVTFNGTPAQFGVISTSLIKAQVPAGAASGTVQVTTPTGMLNSNVNFQVLPQK